MTRTWNSGRALALLASAALVTSSFVAPAASAATAHKADKSSRSSKLTRDAKSVLAKGTAQAPGETVIAADGYDGSGSLSVFSYQTLKVALGVRLTIPAAQTPFTIQAVDALILPNNDGAGLNPGEAIEIRIYADATSSGDLSNFVLLHSQNDVVLDSNESITYPLDTPVTVGQGDVFIVIIDRSTDAEGSAVVY